MGRVFGNRWEVTQSLGEGGQGWVYQVRDTTTGEGGFVLKRLKNPSRLARFNREIEAAGRLRHEGICPAVDFSLEDPAFVVTPLVVGKSLGSMAGLTPLESLRLFTMVCEVVEHAHEAGVVHRDLKPDNTRARGSNRGRSRLRSLLLHRRGGTPHGDNGAGRLPVLHGAGA